MDEMELKKRTKAFALRAMKLVGALPETAVGRTIGTQLVRAATSVGANYRAACRGRSKPEFVAKLGICLQELEETLYWIELLTEAELIKNPNRLTPLQTEVNELIAIFTSISKKTKANM